MFLSGVDITVSDKTTEGAKMDTNTQRFLNECAALTTLLHREARVDSNDLMSSSHYSTIMDPESVTIQVLFPRRRRRRTREKGNMRGHPAPRQGTAVPCTPAQLLPERNRNMRIYTYVREMLSGTSSSLQTQHPFKTSTIVREALIPYLGTRLALLIVGLLADFYILPLMKSNPILPSPTANTHFPDTLWLMWQRFDSGFYLDIAKKGYWPARTLHTYSNWAFYPLGGLPLDWGYRMQGKAFES